MIRIVVSPPATAIFRPSGEKSSVKTPLDKPVIVPTNLSSPFEWSKTFASLAPEPPAAMYFPCGSYENWAEYSRLGCACITPRAVHGNALMRRPLP